MGGESSRQLRIAALLPESIEIGQFAVGHHLFGEDRIHAVDADDDDFFLAADVFFRRAAGDDGRGEGGGGGGFKEVSSVNVFFSIHLTNKGIRRWEFLIINFLFFIKFQLLIFN